MYGKFFESAFTGSMFGAGVHVFAVWGYIIAHCKQDSRVEINPDLVAVVLGTDRKQVDDALDYLSSPDPKSRNKEHDGRRIVKESEYTWLVVNHSLYRNIRTSDELRQYNRERKQISRQRMMSNVKSSQDQCHSIQKTDTDKQKTDTSKKRHDIGGRFTKPSPVEVDDYIRSQGYTGFTGQQFCDYYEARGWVVGRVPMKSWQAAARTWGAKNPRVNKGNQAMSRDVAEALGIKT